MFSSCASEARSSKAYLRLRWMLRCCSGQPRAYIDATHRELQAGLGRDGKGRSNTRKLFGSSIQMIGLSNVSEVIMALKPSAYCSGNLAGEAAGLKYSIMMASVYHFIRPPKSCQRSGISTHLRCHQEKRTMILGTGTASRMTLRPAARFGQVGGTPR